jgi:hypothetical protein
MGKRAGAEFSNSLLFTNNVKILLSFNAMVNSMIFRLPTPAEQPSRTNVGRQTGIS